jgi:cation transport regulator ChaB
MSTLTTRIAGYKFTIVRDGERALGMFNTFDPSNNVQSIHDLPTELRSTFSQAQGQTLPILAGAVAATEDLHSRVAWSANRHDYNDSGEQCRCDNCTIWDGLFGRKFQEGRKVSWV